MSKTHDDIVTVTDIEDRLGRSVDADEKRKATILIDDAVAMVEGWLRQPIPVPVPRAVVAVVGRMVVRALGQDAAGATGAESLSQSAGSFSVTTRYGTTGGGVWLNAQDKVMLAPWRRRLTLSSCDYVDAIGDVVTGGDWHGRPGLRPW